MKTVAAKSWAEWVFLACVCGGGVQNAGEAASVAPAAHTQRCVLHRDPPHSCVILERVFIPSLAITNTHTCAHTHARSLTITQKRTGHVI